MRHVIGTDAVDPLSNLRLEGVAALAVFAFHCHGEVLDT
jgi:hypothetical protein